MLLFPKQNQSRNQDWGLYLSSLPSRPGTGLYAQSMFNTSTSYLIPPLFPTETHKGILSEGLYQSPSGDYDNYPLAHESENWGKFELASVSME